MERSAGNNIIDWVLEPTTPPKGLHHPKAVLSTLLNSKDWKQPSKDDPAIINNMLIEPSEILIDNNTWEHIIDVNPSPIDANTWSGLESGNKFWDIINSLVVKWPKLKSLNKYEYTLLNPEWLLDITSLQHRYKVSSINRAKVLNLKSWHNCVIAGSIKWKPNKKLKIIKFDDWYDVYEVISRKYSDTRKPIKPLHDPVERMPKDYSSILRDL